MQNHTTQRAHTYNNLFDIGLLPPQDLGAESIIIGVLLNSDYEAKQTVYERVRESDFFNTAYAHVFRIISEYRDQGKEADIIKVRTELSKAGVLEQYGGVKWVMELSNPFCWGEALHTNIDHVINCSIKRKTIETLKPLIYKMHDMSYDAHEVIPDLEDVGVGVLERLSVSGASKLNEVIIDVMTDVGARASGITKDGVRTYINSVDRLIHQWGNSDLIVVGARPAMGKTSFIVSAGLNMAKNNVPVGVFSLEMSSKQLVSRIISQELEIASDDIMKRAMDETRLMHVNKNLNKLDGLPMYFDDKAALSIEDFKVRAARMVKTHGVKCIFVDYLQLMTSRESNKRGTNREQEISSISRGLKVTAKELNIPIVVLSQLSREVEKRSDKRPLLSDLRESGSIEQDADQVGFLYRPEYYGVTQDQNGCDVSGIGEYICAKNRNGGLGIARMRFIPEYTKYCDESVGYAPSQMKPNTDFTQSANQIDEAPF